MDALRLLTPWGLVATLTLGASLAPRGHSAEIVLQDGRRIAGELASMASMQGERGATAVEPGAPVVEKIQMIDTGLKRVYVPRLMLTNVVPGHAGMVFENISIKQRRPMNQGQVNNVSGIRKITPFDKFGRRTFVIGTATADVPVIQGITNITPEWTRVQGLTHSWDMRVATSSIPFETLREIIAQGVDANNEQHRLDVARLLVQMRRYGDARLELEGILEDFPAMRDRVEPIARSLVQLRARQILDEVELRRDSGQHVLARAMLEQFPVEGVAGEILEEVRQRTSDLREQAQQAESAWEKFHAVLEKMPDDRQRRALAVRDEIFSRRASLIVQDFEDPLRFCTEVAEQWLNVAPTDNGQVRIMPSPGRALFRFFDEQHRDDLLAIAREGQASRDQGHRILVKLNEVLRWRALYSPEDFAAVALPQEAQRLVDAGVDNLTLPELERLNRLLLEAAYPDEIRRSNFTGLTFNTLPRLEPFLLLADDQSLEPDEKISIAISGWLLGPTHTETQFAVAMSLFTTRNLIVQYLTADTAHERKQILAQIARQESGDPESLHKLLAMMKPPLDTPPQELPGFFELQVESGIQGEPKSSYYVQLPPEYDPAARYPTIVSLHGVMTSAGTSVLRPVDNPLPSQIDWWCGAPGPDGQRRGQAMRHGYIVIAPVWANHQQTGYEYSAREHAVVLASLRDACRRFAIDTDRVFLQGHGTGGDAAWDIGLAHPDLWAGVIPIVGRSDRYCARYWRNGKLVPFYVVAGELDSDLVIQNAREYDRFMRTNFDITVNEYRGRGHEHFIEDQLDIFDWMKRRKRDFYPEEFQVHSMRPWDNFFWWIEVGELPARAIVHPAEWEEKNPKASPAEIKGRLLPNSNGLQASGSTDLTVYLSPHMGLDFSQPIEIALGSGQRRRKVMVRPDIELLLEDARTRADRQHPFWAKLNSRDR